MARVQITKVVSALPATLTPNTIYAVRVGAGFSLYISDSTGAIAHAINSAAGASVVTGFVELDFGADPGTDYAETTVTIPNSPTLVNVGFGNTTAENTADDHFTAAMHSRLWSSVTGTNLTISMFANDIWAFTGKYRINWSYTI